MPFSGLCLLAGKMTLWLRILAETSMHTLQILKFSNLIKTQRLKNWKTWASPSMSWQACT